VRLRCAFGQASIAAMTLISILPLAHAPVRRDHLSNYGHT
jgi:hypothetical protein